MKAARTGGTSILRGVLEKRFRKVFHNKDHTEHFQRWLLRIDDESLKDYFLFTFIRNPWDRVVSLACYFKMSVAELLTIHVDGRKTNSIWIHSLPLVFYTHFKGRQFVDFIGRFEQLQQDFDQVCRVIGLEPVALPRMNTTERLADYSSYFDAKTRDLVARRYHEDIAAFGYSFAKGAEKKLRVLLLHHKSRRRRSYIRPYLRAMKSLKRYGIVMRDRTVGDESDVLQCMQEPSDLYLLTTQVVWPACLRQAKPTVLIEAIDGAQLDAARKYLDHSAVVGLIKGYTLRPPELHNRVRRRYHAHLLAQAGFRAPRSIVKDGLPAQLSLEALGKIRVGLGFGPWGHFDQYRGTKFEWDADRPIDLHFVGTVRYRGSEIELHRRAALDCVQNYPRTAIAAPGIPFCARKYLKTLLMSKAVLSPWGWGQATLRDYEALFCGCVLVKPDSDHVEAWPDIFQAGKTYVPCRPDFSDVHELVLHIADHWDEYLPMRQLGRAMVVDGWRHQSAAARIAGILRDCWKRVEAAR
jgi:hypothetical protein